MGSMAVLGGDKDKELRIHESLDELGTDLADYIAELSETSVKERGVFALAISGGSLIGLMGYHSNALPFTKVWFILFYDFCLLFFGLNLWWKTENSVKLLITRL